MTDSKADAGGGRIQGLLSKIHSRKVVPIILILAAVLGIGYFILGQNGMGGITGGKTVEFTRLDADQVPQAIEKDVIPEYRELERALGCLVDGKVYVVVTRGEKPTAEYGVSIEKIQLETTETGQNLVVMALFTEPEEGKAVAQIITYPYQVAETTLQTLPDTIELRTRFE